MELVSNPAQMPELLHRAMRVAIGQRGVAVLVIPGDVALKSAPEGAPTDWPVLHQPRLAPAEADVARLVELLDGSERVTILAGSGCASAHDEVVALAARLGAPVVHALRGKEHVEWDNPFDVGMTGLIGFSSGYEAMLNCDTLLMLGTDFPYRAFYPANAKIVQVDRDPGALGRRAPLTLGILGGVAETVSAVLPRLKANRSTAFLDAARAHYAKARAGLDDLARPSPEGRPIHPQYLARLRWPSHGAMMRE